MWIGWLELDLLLGDVHSLKEKRSLVRPLIGGIRRHHEVSVAEVDHLELHRRSGVGVGVVSSSRNCGPVLKAAKIDHLFQTRVDGLTLAELGLPGKPAPDSFLKAAENLGARPDRTVVVEDAISGVQSGRAGNFALVLGVDREGHADALLQNGADAIVRDLGEMLDA